MPHFVRDSISSLALSTLSFLSREQALSSCYSFLKRVTGGLGNKTEHCRKMRWDRECVFSGGWGDLLQGRSEIKQPDLITHAQHVKAVVSGVAYSPLGFRFASCAALETPLPSWQTVCWHAHQDRVTKTEQIVGIKQDVNICTGAEPPQLNTCQDVMRMRCRNRGLKRRQTRSSTKTFVTKHCALSI